MLQSSCSILTFEDSPSLSNWTRGMKLQNTRSEWFHWIAFRPLKEALGSCFLTPQGMPDLRAFILTVWGQVLIPWTCPFRSIMLKKIMQRWIKIPKASKGVCVAAYLILCLHCFYLMPEYVEMCSTPTIMSGCKTFDMGGRVSSGWLRQQFTRTTPTQQLMNHVFKAEGPSQWVC